MTGLPEELSIFIAETSVGISAVAALLVAVVTSVLSRRREREADWRKLRFEQYEEFIQALSGVVRDHATEDA
jgi:Zn-dependent protease with chaperone function